MEDVAQLKAGQVLGKDFRVLRPLAAGGMGAVYLVEQLSTGRERALKIMHPQFVQSEDSRARFTQEAKVGTPRWMAPEQSDQGAAIRPATDVWALGLIAFNCLTGKYYWRTANIEKANLTALLRELVLEPIVPPSQRAAELGATGAMPRGFDDWFNRCVERDQNRRYQDANIA